MSPNYGSSRFFVERDVPTFKELMVRSSFDKHLNVTVMGRVRLHEFKNDKRFVIRKGDREALFESARFTDAIETCRKVKSLFNELDQKYAIRTPTHFVVAEDSLGKPAFFILTERVSAITFEDMAEEEKCRAAAQLKKIFEILIGYYEDKLQSGEDFLCDLPDAEQYVYGSLNGSANQWHFVDTDPFFSKDKEVLWDTLDSGVEEAIETVEEKFSINLSEVRRRNTALKKKVAKILDP